LSARLGDILSQMYLMSATLKRYEAEGRQTADAPLMHWAIWDAMYKAQQAFDGVIATNYPNKFVGWLLQKLIFLRPAFFQFLPDPCRLLYLKTVFRQGFLFYLLFSFDLITHGIVHLSFSIINGIHLFVKFCSSISYITELFFS
jgi:hypothetical protein